MRAAHLLGPVADVISRRQACSGLPAYDDWAMCEDAADCFWSLIEIQPAAQVKKSGTRVTVRPWDSSG